MYIYICVQIDRYIYMQIYVNMYIYVYICVCIYIYLYAVYIHMYEFEWIQVYMYAFGMCIRHHTLTRALFLSLSLAHALTPRLSPSHTRILSLFNLSGNPSHSDFLLLPSPYREIRIWYIYLPLSWFQKTLSSGFYCMSKQT